MKCLKLIICILVIALLSFSLISCGKQAATTTTNSVVEVTTIQTTSTLAEGLWDEDNQATIEEATTTTIRETTTTMSIKEADNNLKAAIKDFIENGFKGKLTKMIIADDMSNITISYNTMWSSEDRVKKEMFDVTTVFTGATTILFDLDLSATTQSGNTYDTFTDNDNLYKIKALEMSYKDWLQVAFK